MKILIFTEGTILMHSSGIVPNKGRVDWKKFSQKDPSVYDYASYVPIGKASGKILAWQKQSAQILYLTSRKKSKEVKDIQNILNKYKFPKGKLLFRKGKEEYKDVAERIIPDILIEDDCESIGGEKEMTITYVKPIIKAKIKSIPIKELYGIDHLPNNLEELKSFSSS